MFSQFLAKKEEITEAVHEAFELGAKFADQLTFTVSIKRTVSTSPEKHVQLILDKLRDFETPDDIVFATKRHLQSVLTSRASDEGCGGADIDAQNRGRTGDIELAGLIEASTSRRSGHVRLSTMDDADTD